MAKYIKVRFTSKNNGSTAGVVLTVEQMRTMPMTELSRMFPYSEVRKMERRERSPEYATWDEAFLHTFSVA